MALRASGRACARAGLAGLGRQARACFPRVQAQRPAAHASKLTSPYVFRPPHAWLPPFLAHFRSSHSDVHGQHAAALPDGRAPRRRHRHPQHGCAQRAMQPGRAPGIRRTRRPLLRACRNLGPCLMANRPVRGGLGWNAIARDRSRLHELAFPPRLTPSLSISNPPEDDESFILEETAFYADNGFQRKVNPKVMRTGS